MTIEEALVKQLTSLAAPVVALIGTRVYPGQVPQNATLPLLVYDRVSTVRALTHDGPGRLASARFQLTAWGQTYASARAVLGEVRRALDGFAGLLGGAGGVVVQRGQVVDERDLDVEADIGLYPSALDVMLVHHDP